MKVMVLSNLKKVKGSNRERFTKRQVKEADVFMYDLFWFTDGNKRYGFEVDEIVKFRDNHEKELEREIKKLKK